MAITRIQRKLRKNRKVSNLRKQNIKLLTATPVIKKITVEELKKEIAASK
jgi:hypothetical protein